MKMLNEDLGLLVGRPLKDRKRRSYREVEEQRNYKRDIFANQSGAYTHAHTNCRNHCRKFFRKF